MAAYPIGQTPLRTTLARVALETRLALGLTLDEVADRAAISPAYVWAIERGRANPSLAIVERLLTALRIEIGPMVRPPIVHADRRERDLVHARCSGYAHRRLVASGFEVAREVEVVHGRAHGWIDLLAFDPRSDSLLVIEVKTRIDDLGEIERRLAWYERMAGEAARSLDWRPRRVIGCLLLLATEENDIRLRLQRDVIDAAFRATVDLRALVGDPARPWSSGRGLALIDPSSRRRDWLIRPRLQGRRAAAPYRDYADAARRLGI